MIEVDHKELSVAEQCRVLKLNRSAYYYECSDRRSDDDLEDLKLILTVLGSKAFYGYRKIARELKATHRHLTSKRVRRIMHQFGLRAIYPTLNLSRPRKGHKKYPYLLREKEIRHPNQVWATDVTYCALGLLKPSEMVNGARV